MIKASEFRNHFNLQRGEKCFIIDNKLIITSDYKINVDSFQPKKGIGRNIRKLRLILNIIAAVLVFIIAFGLKIYPVLVVMFLILWDIKQLKSYTHPISNSNCISVDWIEDVKIRKGKLGFSYIDLFFTDDKKNLVMRPLKVYDSDEELEIAIKSFEKLGFLLDGSSVIAKGEFIEGESYKCNNRTEVVFNDKGVFFTKDGRFDNSNPDAFGIKVALYILLSLIGIVFTIIQSMRLYEDGFNYPGLTLLIIVILLTSIPFRKIRKVSVDFISKDQLISYKKLDSYNSRITFLINGIKFYKIFPVLHFDDFEKIEQSFLKIKN